MSRAPGRQSQHSLSFGSDYDPERLSFGPLVALNDELLGAAAGFEAHEHADVVLVTWVVFGALTHEDADGPVIQPAGDLAVTQAGSGITHSERADGVPTRFVQAWLRPGESGADTRPTRRTTTPDLSGGDLVLAADETDLGVPGTELRMAALPMGATLTLTPAPLRYALVVTGALTRSSLAEPLAAGDAFEVTGDHEITVTAAVPTHLMVWSFAG